jgi:hypothetical protein
MLPPAESIQIILPIASVLLLVMSLKNPVYGVIAYFVILNAKLGEMYPVLGAIRFELLAAVYVLLRIFISGKGLKNVLPASNPINKAFLVLFLVGMISVVFSIDPAVSWSEGGYFLLKLGVFYLMIVSTLRTSADLTKILWAFILVTAWIAYEPVANYISGVVNEQMYGAVAYGRFGAASGHVALANTLNQAIPVILFFALTSRKRFIRITSLMILALLVFGVYASKSRGGFLGLFIIAMGIVYFSRYRMRAGLIAGAFMFFFLTLAASDYLSHMSSIQEGIHASRTSSDRYLGLVNGISMMIKRPVLGVGIGCYAEARSRYFHYYFYAHNLYGELFGELGMASIAWFYFIYLVFRRTIAIKRNLDSFNARDRFYINILNAVQLGLFLRLFVGNFTHGSFIWFWFMMAALTVGIQNILLQEKRAPLGIS